MPNAQGRKNETSQNLASVRGNNDTYDQPYRVGRDYSSTLSSEDLRAQSCGGTCPRLHKVFSETPGLEGISPFSPGSFLFSSFFHPNCFRCVPGLASYSRLSRAHAGGEERAK